MDSKDDETFFMLIANLTTFDMMGSEAVGRWGDKRQ